MTGNLFAELKRRKVTKVGAAYLVVAWLAVQAASIGFPAFDAPAWVLRIFILVLLLGFPIVLVLTWMLDLTPEGMRLDASAAGNKRVIAVAVGLVALALVWYFVGQPSVRPGQTVIDSDAAMVTANTTTAKTSVVDNKSIAVLAFSDLSPGHDQDHFSDGMAEEILNALVRIKDLKVAGRTSSFFYKGRNVDLREIGKALGVAHVLEGSVRTQGDKVRITAQLVRSSDGIHLWSQAYDGDLADVFKLQDQIARAIASELQLVLVGDQIARLVPVATTNPEAYELYLRASAALNRRDYPAMIKSVAWLERAIKLDPKFARAESLLAVVHGLGQVRNDAVWAEAEKHARAAMALDPTLAQPLYALGIIARDQRRYVEAREWHERALALEPRDASANLYLGQLLIINGYTQQGIARLDRALAIDPMLPNALNWRAYQHAFAGDLDTALAMFETAQGLGLGLSRGGLAEVAYLRKDYARTRELAAPQSLAVAAGRCLDDPATQMRTVAAGANGGDAAERARALAVIDGCLKRDPDARQSWIAMALLKLGESERALKFASRVLTDDAGTFFILWSPRGAAVRQLPEFGAAAERIGFVDAWEKYGPPDLCKRTAPRQYSCR